MGRAWAGDFSLFAQFCGVVYLVCRAGISRPGLVWVFVHYRYVHFYVSVGFGWLGQCLGSSVCLGFSFRRGRGLAFLSVGLVLVATAGFVYFFCSVVFVFLFVFLVVFLGDGVVVRLEGFLFLLGVDFFHFLVCLLFFMFQVRAASVVLVAFCLFFVVRSRYIHSSIAAFFLGRRFYRFVPGQAFIFAGLVIVDIAVAFGFSFFVSPAFGCDLVRLMIIVSRVCFDVSLSFLIQRHLFVFLLLFCVAD
ncbi:hypothetical protein [Escherichia coli]|uniref:hypothetical protein n=1 Tax=Escherichia coli TaxID=562 RepID=UPI000658C5E6|nr:hypothetical protein [Escherichia coli]KLX63940.1 hypothetical protein SK79_01223 [Escherichia coli]